MKKLLLTLSAAFLCFTSFAQWNPQTSGTSNWFTGVYFTSATEGHAVNGSGEIYKTIDAGANWTLQASTGSSLYGVAFGGANNGIAIGAGGTSQHTTDGGNTWTLASTGQGYALSSVFFVDLDTAYAVGNSGTILKTYNGGVSWSPRTSGTISDLYGVYFTDFNEGYAVGLSGTIIKTTDAGLTWNTLSSGSSANLFSVYFTDLSNGYVVGQTGNILKTYDGGTTWNSMPSGQGVNLTSVRFTDANNGYAVGQLGVIVKTFDAGYSWYQQTSHTTNDLSGVFFTDANNGFAVGANGTILSTTDGGCTVPNITIAGTTTICTGDVTNLTASGASSYTWSPASNLSCSTCANPVASPPSTSNYTITGVDSGCVNTTAVSITVNALPGIFTTPNDVTCNGLCNGSTGATGTSITYTWQPGNIIANTITNLCPGVYTVTGTDANGCMSTVTSFITEPSVLSASIGSFTPALCTGVDNGSAMDNSSGGTAPYNYSWSPSGETTPTATMLATGTVSLTISDAQGCVSGTAMFLPASQTVSVTVSGPANLCQGQAGQLTYTVSGGTTPYSPAWYDFVMGNTFCLADTALLTASVSGLDSVHLYITDNSGCTGMDPFIISVGYADSLSGFITEPNSNPVAGGIAYLFQQKTSHAGLLDTIGVIGIVNGAYSFPNTYYGEYFVKVVADTTAYPTSIATYYSNKPYPFQWDSALVINHHTCSAANITGYDVSILEITPLTGPGVITGIISAGPGYGMRFIHGGYAPMGAPLKGVDVKLGRNPGGSPAARTTTDTTNGTFTFTNVPLNQSFRIYVDIPNYGMDSVLTVMLTATNTVSNNNNYYVDSVMIRVDTAGSVGIISLKDNNTEIAVYPNPASNKIHVEWKGNDRTELTLINALGTEVWKQTLKQNRTDLDVSTLADGIYFVQARTSDSILTKKIIVQH